MGPNLLLTIKVPTLIREMSYPRLAPWNLKLYHRQRTSVSVTMVMVVVHKAAKLLLTQYLAPHTNCPGTLA